jgi:hypothetical protein
VPYQDGLQAALPGPAIPDPILGPFDSPGLGQDKPELIGVLASQDAGDQGRELCIEMEACESNGPRSLMSQWPNSTGATWFLRYSVQHDGRAHGH